MRYQGNVFFVKIFETLLLYVLISEKMPFIKFNYLSIIPQINNNIKSENILNFYEDIINFLISIIKK